jgi:hypothetical protein
MSARLISLPSYARRGGTRAVCARPAQSDWHSAIRLDYMDSLMDATDSELSMHFNTNFLSRCSGWHCSHPSREHRVDWYLAFRHQRSVGWS